jgi:hypothetical protein
VKSAGLCREQLRVKAVEIRRNLGRLGFRLSLIPWAAAAMGFLVWHYAPDWADTKLAKILLYILTVPAWFLIPPGAFIICMIAYSTDASKTYAIAGGIISGLFLLFLLGTLS